jgi:hypothetical protein
MACEAGDLFEVRSLGQRCEITDPHVLDHANAKWGHDQLPCETNSATWRRPIVSRLSCQTRGEAEGGCHHQARWCCETGN